jgi:hypothetical protein
MSERPALAAARARLAAKAGPVSAAASKEVVRAAPTTEQGVPGAVLSPFGGFGGRPDWAYFIDDREFAVELQWPRSVEVNERMETTDAQVKGLLLATFLPIRRFRWELDPADAKPEAVALTHEDLNLPVRGDEESVSRRGGFNHDKHLGHALRAVGQGHYHFEEKVEWRDPAKGGDGLLHLVKLATRPPRSIIGIRTDDHGNLEAIEQMAGGIGIAGGQRIMGGIVGGIRVLKADRLLTYLWDTADDGDQVGRSVLRACYRNFLVKDALIRVDAVKHERNAMGIPWFEVDPATSKEQIESLAQRAEEIRASTVGGGAGPGKLRIAGVEGTLPDTIASIRYHDEQMAKALMQMLFNLGGDANSGARALGDTFAERAIEFQGAIADWYCEATQAFIDRQIERNFGPGEASPQISYTRTETYEVAFADLANGVKEGLIAVTPELRAYVEERWKVPGQKGAPELPEPVNPGANGGQSREEAAPTPASAAEGGSKALPAPPAPAQPKRTALAERLLTTLTAPMTWPQLAKAAGTDPKNGTARRARDLLMADGGIYKRTDGTLAPVVALSLPERDLKRAPLPFEVTAQVDFAAMEDTFTQGRASLVDTYRAAQAAQIDQLVAEVEAAAGDAAALATLDCDPVDVDVLAGPLLAIAEAGVTSAESEHEAQMGASASDGDQSGHSRAKKPGIAFTEPEIDGDRLEATVRERAETASLTLSSGLAGSASKKAASVSTLEPEAAATIVRDHLTSLSDAALTEQLGGATQQAYNAGRFSYMDAAGPKSLYSSEILDGNTCTECNAVDGTEYDTMAELREDYPVGGYVGCLAGLRCRGTGIATY